MRTFAEFWGKSKVFSSCLVEKCVLSSYYKVSHILFIYLVGRACIPGIFCWFVLLYFFFSLSMLLFFFPFLLKRPDHPVGTSLLGDKAAVVNFPKPACSGPHHSFCKSKSWLAAARIFQERISLFQSMVANSRWHMRQRNYRRNEN